MVGDESPPELDQLGHPFVGHLVEGETSGAAHLEQAAADQAGEVSGDAALGEARVGDALGPGPLALRAEGEESQAGGVAEGPVEAREEVSTGGVVGDGRNAGRP